MSDDVLGENEEDAQAIAILIRPDEETYMPEIIVGIPIEVDGELRFASTTMTPEEVISMASVFVNTGIVAAQIAVDLISKTIEERREVADLYASFNLDASEGPEGPS